jgi:hypothetical protein
MDADTSDVIIMEMRAAIMVLALATGLLQSVRVADCACETVCRCGERECAAPGKPVPPPPLDGCCPKDAGTPLPAESPHRDPGCTHVDPPHEILPEDGLSPKDPPVAAPAAAPDFAAPPAVPADGIDGPFGDVRGSPPLYLLHSVLLI